MVDRKRSKRAGVYKFSSELSQKKLSRAELIKRLKNWDEHFPTVDHRLNKLEDAAYRILEQSTGLPRANWYRVELESGRIEPQFEPPDDPRATVGFVFVQPCELQHYMPDAPIDAIASGEVLRRIDVCRHNQATGDIAETLQSGIALGATLSAIGFELGLASLLESGKPIPVAQRTGGRKSGDARSARVRDFGLEFAKEQRLAKPDISKNFIAWLLVDKAAEANAGSEGPRLSESVRGWEDHIRTWESEGAVPRRRKTSC